MSEAGRSEAVIDAACEAFGVDRAALGRMRGQDTEQAVRMARMACAVLAGPAGGVSMVTMAGRIGYRSIRYFRQMRRNGLVWMKWAELPEPPRPEAAVFRDAVARICKRLEVDFESVAGGL